jgi:hypothetical protein
LTNAVARQAQSAETNAYNFLAALPSTANLNSTGTLGGLTLTPGVYTFASSALLTGTLTLNFKGATDQDFVSARPSRSLARAAKPQLSRLR